MQNKKQLLIEKRNLIKNSNRKGNKNDSERTKENNL